MIKIYSKQNCEKCEILEDICKQSNTDYIKEDITGNVLALSLLKEKIREGMGFPIVAFEDDYIIAGDIDRIVEKINSFSSKKEEEKKDLNENVEYEWGVYPQKSATI